MRLHQLSKGLLYLKIKPKEIYNLGQQAASLYNHTETAQGTYNNSRGAGHSNIKVLRKMP